MRPGTGHCANRPHPTGGPHDVAGRLDQGARPAVPDGWDATAI
jgi:hypothetical protein